MNKISEEEATRFARQLAKWKDGIKPGMSMTVFIYTGDQKIDMKPRKARVVKKYRNYCLLEDDRGLKYGPTWHTLMEWEHAV